MYNLTTNRVVLGIIFLMFLGFSCTSVKQYGTKLCAVKWQHNHENDQGKIKAYVPASTQLSPSRPRKKLHFMSDGSFALYTGGRSDRGEATNGTWKWENKKEKIISYTVPDYDGNDQLWKFKIVELTSEVLKLERVEQ